MLSVYTMDGKLAMQRSVSLQSGYETIDISLLRTGQYVARVSTPKGTLCSCKFKL